MDLVDERTELLVVVSERSLVVSRFSYTFRTTRKRVDGDWEIIYPIVSVSVPNYAEETVDCGWP